MQHEPWLGHRDACAAEDRPKDVEVADGVVRVEAEHHHSRGILRSRFSPPRQRLVHSIAGNSEIQDLHVDAGCTEVLLKVEALSVFEYHLIAVGE